MSYFILNLQDWISAKCFFSIKIQAKFVGKKVCTTEKATDLRYLFFKKCEKKNSVIHKKFDNKKS